MATSTEPITIPTWANGPDDSGNGGWSAGLLAERLGDEAIASGVAVNLRLPPPLGRPLRVTAAGDGLELHDDVAGEDPALVATAEPAQVDLHSPSALQGIDPATAAAASDRFPFRDRHPFPRCVCCGIDRGSGEVALRLHCGPVPGITTDDGAQVFVDRWQVAPDVADPADPDVASVPATWSALDCPSAAPIADPDSANPIVLARIAVRIDRRPLTGEPHVLAAWHVASDGRKHRTRSVMAGAGGAIIAAADALWIEVRPR